MISNRLLEKNAMINWFKKGKENLEANFIIHGLREEISAKDLINMLLPETDVKFIPKESKRLGNQTGNKTRPLMVEIEIEILHAKNKVMTSPNKLKNTECEQLQRISVTDDYTIEEREEIKRWAEKAKR